MVKEISLPTRVVWDAARIREIDEAKKEIMDRKRAGYLITLGDGSTPMERFKPSLQEVIIHPKKLRVGVMKILDVTGDTRITWDKENGREAMQAKEKFEKLLSEGYKAYSVKSNGEKGRKIEEFDVDAQEILMIPATRKG